jgi:hypothetical protein
MMQQPPERLRHTDSLEDMESFTTSHPAAFSARTPLSSDSLVGLGQEDAQSGALLSPRMALSTLDVRRRAKSLPGDMASSYLPEGHLIPSSIKIVSPLKDISRSKHLISATEISLPLTIGSRPPPHLASPSPSSPLSVSVPWGLWLGDESCRKGDNESTLAT